jgi:hypothetical protein
MTGDRLSAVIRQAEARLRAEWGRTAEVWRDEVAARFTSQFWGPLERSIAQYLDAVEELEEVLNEVESGAA